MKITARFLSLLRTSGLVIALLPVCFGCSEAPERKEAPRTEKDPANKNPAVNNETPDKAAEKGEWAVNEYFGLRFETPTPIVKKPVDMPAGMELYARSVNAYTYSDREIAINFTAIEMIGDQYDTKGGLGGAAGNLVKHMEGTMKSLDFGKVPGEQNTHTCYGTFAYEDTRAELRGYSTFDKETRTALVMIGVGPADNRETTQRINRVFQSIDKTSTAE